MTKQQNSNFSSDPKIKEEQKRILDLEKKYMDIIEGIIKAPNFISDLKNIEKEILKNYKDLQEIWGKKNKIKEASERLLRHHMYTAFNEKKTFYPNPISCDIALVLDDVILNIDVKTIDKNSNSGDLNSTQLEHNQTSFINVPINPVGSFPGFKVLANLEQKDISGKPILTYLIKIGYSDDGDGNFNILNSDDEKSPSLVLTCIPNGLLSELFNKDLCTGFKTYTYYGKKDNADEYYKPKNVRNVSSFKDLSLELQITKIRNIDGVKNTWEALKWDNGRYKKVGLYDKDKETVWQPQAQGNKVYLKAVKHGNTMRFKDKWLKDRYDSNDNPWEGLRKYIKIFD